MHRESAGRPTRALLLATGMLLTVFCTLARAETPADLFAKAAAQGSAQTVDHTAWDRLLKTYVHPGSDGLNRVDYAAFKSGGHAALKDYIRRLEAVDPASLDRPEQFALLANLYNAKTVDIVLDHYPVKSIKDISLGGGLLGVFTGGPWKAKVLAMKGVALSLDDIEHGILRPIFKDARVHYAVNCASVGCPNLGTEAFTGAKLAAQLDAAARAYVNSRRGADPRPDGLVVSSIYNWYEADFGGNEEGVIAHLKTYADPDLAKKLQGTTSIADYAYDWSLNDIE
jgi:Protein of unknown function, DUF547